MAGPALTVKTRPGDNLMLHKALDLAEPGDVIVVDAGGDLTNAIIGEIMSGYAASRGLGGIVINGAIRDAGALRRASFPVYAAGVTHRGPYKDGPGEINVPIAIDGMVIEPGDLIVGDEDGVLVRPLRRGADHLRCDQQEASGRAAGNRSDRQGYLRSRLGRCPVATAGRQARLNPSGRTAARQALLVLRPPQLIDPVEIRRVDQVLVNQEEALDGLRPRCTVGALDPFELPVGERFHQVAPLR